MSKVKQNKKQKPDLIFTFECSCGIRHKVFFGLGELQLFERAIIKRQNPTIPTRHMMLAPTGKTLGTGEPEYLPLKPA